MKCKSCDEEVLDRGRFCSECGRPLRGAMPESRPTLSMAALGIALWLGAAAAFCGLFLASIPQEDQVRPRDPSEASDPRIEWVGIPGGPFMMGDEGFPDSRPRHPVRMKDFEMAKTEVTNRQYRACVRAGACAPPSSYVGDDDHPVVHVDWDQAVRFSEWAGGRLPSEAEWEYAARSAGKDWGHPWGDEAATCGRAVTDDGSWSACGRGSSAWPVCSKPQGNTRQGLCDMAGNVWEWVQDRYQDSYLGAPSDGSPWTGSARPYRVYRGGSWSSGARPLRASFRNYVDESARRFNLGFRPVRDVR